MLTALWQILSMVGLIAIIYVLAKVVRNFLKQKK